MPPKKQFSREQLVEVAFEIACKEGIEGLTVRQVAEQLGSSVAPIYVNFKDIEELKRAVVQRVWAHSRQMMQERYTEDRFLNIGIAGLRFAREYPVLFRELVLTPNRFMADYQAELGDDVMGEMGSDPELEGFTREELGEILLKMRIFQMGLSAMVANGMLPEGVDEQVQIDLLASAGEDVITVARLRKQTQEP